MNWQQEAALALRLLRRDWRAGEIGLLALALVIAVASLTTVGFFTDRVQQALTRQSNTLLGADLIINSDRPFTPAFTTEATARRLTTTRALNFPSMVVRGDANVLTEIKAVATGYPLRGAVQLADTPTGPERTAESVPAVGTVWIDPRLAARLELKVGDVVGVGQRQLQVAALVIREPEGVGLSVFNSLPRLLMNEADIAATALIQTGSRVRYRWYAAGDAAAIAAYRNWVSAALIAGQNIENTGEGSPLGSALQRTEQFLGFAALISVVIAAAALALAARRFVVRHLDACAVMRCIGARQSAVLRLYTLHFLSFGLLASVLGCVIGYTAQMVLASGLSSLLGITLPAPSLRPAWEGIAAGVVLLAGFALPPLASLGQVPALRVLRRELGLPRGLGVLGYAVGLTAICALVLWKAHDPKLGAYVLGGFAAAAVVMALLSAALLRLLAGVRADGGIGWRHGIANLQRHTLASVLQIVAFGIGLMALLTITLIRGDLMQSWQETLRPDLPNRFIINIQPDQTQPLTDFFAARQMTPPALYPMVRGRLVAVNGRSVSGDDYADERARRLIEREFNLSWLQAPPANRIVAGRWWTAEDTRSDQLSIEQGIAKTLQLKLGDALTYDVAGSPFTATITSVREVDWNSFSANFFVIGTPALLRDYPASYITSFYASPQQITALNEVVRLFPNFVIIDIAQILTQLRNLIRQAGQAVQFVFLFTLAAGIAVLYAALAATRDERQYEAAVVRTLGASRRQIAATQFTEFAVMGALAGLLAAAGASALGYMLARQVLDIPYFGTPWIWLWGIGGGTLVITAAGMLGVRQVLETPPLQVLRRAAE